MEPEEINDKDDLKSEETTGKDVFAITIRCKPNMEGYSLEFHSGDSVERQPRIDEAIIALEIMAANLKTDWTAIKLFNRLEQFSIEQNTLANIRKGVH